MKPLNLTPSVIAGVLANHDFWNEPKNGLYLYTAFCIRAVSLQCCMMKPALTHPLEQAWTVTLNFLDVDLKTETEPHLLSYITWLGAWFMWYNYMYVQLKSLGVRIRFSWKPKRQINYTPTYFSNLAARVRSTTQCCQLCPIYIRFCSEDSACSVLSLFSYLCFTVPLHYLQFTFI